MKRDRTIGIPLVLASAGAVAAALSLFPSRALACGASAGNAGVFACSLAEHEEEVRKKWHLGVAGGYTSTAITFGSGLTLDETRGIALALMDYRISPRWTFEAGAGSLFGGHLRGAGTEHDFSPGLLTTLGASWRVLDARDERPFVLFTGQAAYIVASTRDANAPGASAVGYEAFDLRIGALVGWSIADAFAPYALARAFGGPVYWRFEGEERTGTDTHHYQLGAGLSVLIAKRVDLFVEGVPLGEQGVSGGAGVAF